MTILFYYNIFISYSKFRVRCLIINLAFVDYICLNHSSPSKNINPLFFFFSFFFFLNYCKMYFHLENVLPQPLLITISLTVGKRERSHWQPILWRVISSIIYVLHFFLWCKRHETMLPLEGLLFSKLKLWII